MEERGSTMLFKGDEKKVFKLNLDTHLYTRQIKDYQKYTNVIDLNLTKALLDLVNTVQDFLNEAQVKETSKASLSLGIKTNFDSKIALLRKSYICSLCNVEISGRENMIKHFCDQKHLKNVKIKDNLMQQNNDPPTVPIKNTSISSNHSDRAPSISSNKSNKAPSISSNHSNKAPSNPSERKSSDLKPLTTAQIQRNLKRAEKQEKLRMLALNPFSEELPKQTVQLLSKPIQQLEQLTMRLIDDGKALAKNIVTYQAVCSHIENALRVIYPNIKCYVFGSRITGLSTAKGDIDIFVDIGGRFYNRPTKGEIFDAIHKTESFLKKTKKFSNFQKVLAARTPILKTFCLAERIDCDLSFSNGLSFCNTELINYFLNLQPVCRKLVTFLKYWFGPNMNNIGVSNYLVTLLAIFYLQKQKILPSVALLQKNLEPVSIQGWKSNFNEPTCQELKLKPNDDFKKHLTNFFHFYGYQFNHQTDIVCPLLGVECQKAMFEPQNVVPLPLEFVPYQQYMMNIDLRVADEVDDLFANRKPLVVQDPFDLIHNVGKGMVQNKLNRFIAFSRRSYEMLH